MSHPKWPKRSMIWVDWNGTCNHCCKCSLLGRALSIGKTVPPEALWRNGGVSSYVMSLDGVRNCWVSPICFLLYFNPFFGFVQACSQLLTLLLFPLITLFLPWFSETRTCFFLLANCRLQCWFILGNLSLKTLSYILRCVWAHWVGASMCVYASENWKGQHPVLVLVMLRVLDFEIVFHQPRMDQLEQTNRQGENPENLLVFFFPSLGSKIYIVNCQL